MRSRPDEAGNARAASGCAAGAIALINSVGNLGGYVGPFIVGWAKDTTKSFNSGRYFLAASILVGALLTYFIAPSERARRLVERPA